MTNLKFWGVTLSVPAGWSGTSNGRAYVMSADDGTGVVLIWRHQKNSLDALKADFLSGISMGEELNLQAARSPEVLSGSLVGCEMSGSMNGTAAASYIVGVLNANGDGIGIMGITNLDYYNGDTYRKLATEIGSSVRFSAPVPPQGSANWQNKLNGTLLSHFENYSGSYGSGGYSSETKISLCQGGNCNYFSQSSVSVSVGGGFGSNSGNMDSRGTWSIVSDLDGMPMLRLSLEGETVIEYNLSTMDNKVGLDGTAFHRSTAGQGAGLGPNCE